MALRILQVGMGGWGRGWASRVVQQNKDVELVACVDTLPTMLELAQATLPLPATSYFTDLDQALREVDCQAVLITASLPGHVSSALTALRAGKHVLLEKPFAATLEEARQVVETAAEHDCLLMISQNYRFYPAVQKVRELVRAQELGPVGAVTIDFHWYANAAPKESNGHYAIWQPLLVDMAIHHFDLMRYVLGQEASQIFCRTWNPAWSNFREAPCAAATITFGEDTVVNYRGSWVSHHPRTCWGGEWSIQCAQGEIFWESRDDERPDWVAVRRLGKRPRKLALPSVPLIDRHGSLNAFVQAVRSGQEPGSSGRDNVKTLALTLAAVESSRRGVPITLSKSYTEEEEKES